MLYHLLEKVGHQGYKSKGEKKLLNSRTWKWRFIPSGNQDFSLGKNIYASTQPHKALENQQTVWSCYQKLRSIRVSLSLDKICKIPNPRAKRNSKAVDDRRFASNCFESSPSSSSFYWYPPSFSSSSLHHLQHWTNNQNSTNQFNLKKCEA